MPNTIQKGIMKKLYITKDEGKYINWVGDPINPRTTMDTGIIKKWDNFEESIRVDKFGAYVEVEIKETNTTQNKEELELKLRKILSKYKVKSFPSDSFREIIKELSQAHQSGIEEERKRIVTQIARLFPVKEEGDFGLMTVEHFGKLKPTIDTSN